MKRLAFALAVAISLAGSARATTVTYDLAGSSLWYDFTGSSPDPYALGVPLSDGSALALDFDGGVVSVAASSLRMHGTRVLGANPGSEVTIETDLVATLHGGSGEVLPLFVGIQFSVAPAFSIAGTVRCTSGPCEAWGFVAGEMSWGEWLERTGLEPADPFASPNPVLQLGPDGIFALLPVAREPTYDSLVARIDLHGRAVPEPPELALLAALALALVVRRFA